MKNRINPIGLKGEINERMKTLMGISTLNENKSNIVVELTKLGPDNKVYAIIRENHEYYIKSTDKVSNIVSEDFKYIGGLQIKNKSIFFIC
jgi:predicted phosphohydrolase